MEQEKGISRDGVTARQASPAGSADPVARHTPGPWRACFDHNGRHEVRGPGLATVAAVFHTPDGRAASNADLLAAAPELLEALKCAAEFIEEETENRCSAGAEYSDYEREPRELADMLRAAIAKAEA